MIPVGWRKIKSWNCIECGMCCIKYHVVLNYAEWINIIRNYGIDATIPSVSNLLLGKKGDGTCCFLGFIKDNYFCGLQYKKPLACKLWPFKIFTTPKFGNSNESIYKYQNQNFFIYIDPACNGLILGKPTSFFKNQVIPEFFEIAVGLCKKQLYSTSKIKFPYFQNRFEQKHIY